MIAASILLSRALAPIEQGTRRLALGSCRRTRAGSGSRRCSPAPAGEEALPLPAPQGAVALERLAYAVDGRAIVRPSSLKIGAGEFLGVVGRPAPARARCAG